MLKRKSNIRQFPYGIQNSQKPYRLFCFHHAGGNAVIFRNWLNFSSHVEVIPIEIPGHSSRMDEACVTDFENIVEEVSHAIASVYDERPVCLYGHSLGAAIAFQTAVLLKKKYQLKVKKLFVAGRQAPMDADVSGFRLEMGLEKMYEELIRMGMTTKKDTEDAVFRKVFQPILVNDYQLSENYTYHGEKIDIPIVALSGDEDYTASEQIMRRWKMVTDSGFTHYEFHGNHFFPYNSNESQVLRILRNEILSTETYEQSKIQFA